MKNTTQFDSLKCLIEGVNIVEAGAGTGKTYNIQNLFARMIIEKGFDISSILVVTFTESATKELKDRIRTILVQIQNYYNEIINNFITAIPNIKNYAEIDGVSLKENSVLDKDYRIRNKYDDRIITIAESNSASYEIKKRRIDSAIRNFDSAAIFTIHGFCNRLLNDFSFESNILFNLELETNPEALIQDIIEDFWRVENYSSDDILTTAFLIKNKITINSLKDFIKVCISQSDILFEPEIKIDSALQEYRNLFNALKKTFNKKELTEILSSDCLKKTSYKPEQIINIVNLIEAFLEGVVEKDTFKMINKISIENIKKNIHKGKEDKFSFLDYETFQIAQKLCELEDVIKSYSPLIKTKCKNYFFKEYSRRKQQLNIQTFDDLLKNVKGIIEQKNSKLKKAAVNKYKAAMIDEFQDTDPVQYCIFKKIFIETGKPVFLVGDPKQAIYAFRGGDIFTYQKAKEENINANMFSLTTNWRSADNMIEAVNEVFSPESISPHPFADDNIIYQKAVPSENKNDLLLNNKYDEKPLKIILADGEHNKTQLEKECSEITANLIYQTLIDKNLKIKENKQENSSVSENIDKDNVTQASLLESRKDKDYDKEKEEYRNIKPKDIAVLVNSHVQARMIKKALNKYKIPSVLQATGSVFDSAEAEEFEYILKAVANPNNSELIKGALLTNTIGFTPNKIIDLTSDINTENQIKYEEIISVFKTLNEICINKSFIEMFNLMCTEFNVKNILLSQVEGERKLTNLTHISELLHDKEINSKLGLNGLIAWLSKQRNSETRDDKDEYEVRLETDNEAVKVMTVHKSKGLEFPIVFCPFLWKKHAVPGANVKDSVICKFHRDGKAVVNLNNSENTFGFHCDEQLQELIRVFYVAVTRAKYQCFIIWGNIKSKKTFPTSSLDYIFRFKNSENLEKGTISINLEDDNSSFSDVNNTRCIELSNFDTGKIIHEEYNLKNNINFKTLNFKIFDTSLIDTNWKITSFSAIAPHESDSELQFDKDHDESDNSTEKNPENVILDEVNIFNFAPGAKTGTCWHSIFENIDFTSSDDVIQKTVNQMLSDFSLDDKENPELSELKQKCVFNMVKNVLSTKLNNADNFSLCNLSESDKLAELEFNFSLKNGFYTKDIADTVFEYSKQFGFKDKIETWNNSFIKGYMTGFIDLVFRHKNKYYIIDWKSNRLDGMPDSFEAPGLKAEIAKNYYFLQYLIYTVALDKFLSQTIPDYNYEKYFGGIYYIFLRGVEQNPESARGFFFDRPDEKLIKKLSEVFSKQL